MNPGTSLFVLLAAGLLLASPPASAAADLQPRTATAYETYAQQAEQAFLTRTRTTSALLCDGVRSGQPAREDGIFNVPGGLVHHWRASAFARGATLDQLVDVSRRYSSYPTMYKAILAATLLSQEGETYRVLMRLKGGEAGVTAVLDVRSTIEYRSPDPATIISLSTAEEIREVEKAGGRDERLLPPGRDSGYLWRANTFSYFRQEQGGVAVEMETLGLSRRFPPLLGWFIEPIARRLGRRSVETSLQEFLTAVRGWQGLSGRAPLCG